MVNGTRKGWLFIMFVGFALSFPGITPHAEGQEAAPTATPAVTPAETQQKAQQATPGETKKEQPGAEKKKVKKKARAPRKPLNTGGRGRFGISLLLGFGIKNHDLGVTTDGDDISLSGGGGAGLALIGGYGLSSKWDIEVSVGGQVSELRPEVSNADGEFNRDFLRATLFYKIPSTPVTQWKIGAGIGAYLAGEWDVDTSAVPGGNHDIIMYDDALGFHITGGYEVVVKESVYFAAELMYYFVEYEANSWTRNSAPQSVNMLNDPFKNLNGSGIDLMLSMGMYF